MAEELNRLLRMGLSGSNGNNENGIFFYLFGKPKTIDVEAERLEYYKIWDEMQRTGDSRYSIHSVSSNQGLPTLPDSTMALCIGLVVGYMIYIIVSLMFQSKLPDEEEKQVSGKVVIIPEHKFQDNVIPDVIKNLYEPAEEFEKVPLLSDMDECDTTSDGAGYTTDHTTRTTDRSQEHITDTRVGVHVGSAFKKCGSHIENL